MARTLFDEVNNDSPSGLYHAIFQIQQGRGAPHCINPPEDYQQPILYLQITHHHAVRLRI